MVNIRLKDAICDEIVHNYDPSTRTSLILLGLKDVHAPVILPKALDLLNLGAKIIRICLFLHDLF